MNIISSPVPAIPSPPSPRSNNDDGNGNVAIFSLSHFQAVQSFLGVESSQGRRGQIDRQALSCWYGAVRYGMGGMADRQDRPLITHTGYGRIIVLDTFFFLSR